MKTLLLKDLIEHLIGRFYIWCWCSKETEKDSFLYFENTDEYHKFPQEHLKQKLDNAEVIYIGTGKDGKTCVLVDKF